MSNSLDLLRMLEPPVRPGGVGAPAGRPQPVPFEEQSFESLLQEIQSDVSQQMKSLSAEPDEATGGAGTPSANLLSPLSDLDAIGNASLRDLITRNHRMGAADR